MNYLNMNMKLKQLTFLYTNCHRSIII